MGNKPLKITNTHYTFFLDGKRIYVKINGTLPQNFTIQTNSFKALDQYSYAYLVDSIYKRKITNTVSLNKHLMSKFRLVPTARKLK